MVVVAKGGMSRAEWEALHAPEQEEPEVNDKVVSESETTSESLEPETEATMANEPENDSSDVTSGDSSKFRPQRMAEDIKLKNRSMTPMIKRMTNLRKKGILARLILFTSSDSLSNTLILLKKHCFYLTTPVTPITLEL